jgi:hypothetical protein
VQPELAAAGVGSGSSYGTGIAAGVWRWLPGDEGPCAHVSAGRLVSRAAQ